MTRKHLVAAFAFVSLLIFQTARATVTPIQENFGDVFPILTSQSLDVFRSSDSPPWFVRFNLLADADVKLGAQALPFVAFNGSFFNLTSIYLVTIDGDIKAFGTDTFTNPFPDPIEALVVANGLPKGEYALAVSGTGNRTSQAAGGPFDIADFTVRIQVTPVPEPEIYALMLIGVGAVGWAVRRRQRHVAERP